MTQIEELKKIVAHNVFIDGADVHIAHREDKNGWLFDFRRILMNGRTANLISDIFYEQFKDQYPFQLCALEVAGVPLVTSLMTKFYYRGVTDINAFFIRKSRKKTDLMRMIEGEVQEAKNIILVDDVMNRGNSFWRQIEVLEELGYCVNTVWSVIRYRDLEYYKRFTDRGINIRSLFTLDDFTEVLGKKVQNLKPKSEELPEMPFHAEWIFKSDNPSLEWVVSKSQPVLDETKIYVGTDNRTFWAINQTDGSVAWRYLVGPQIKKKSIFSSPALYKNLVIFGSYDGSVYALDRNTGKKVWECIEADWVGSSPVVAEDLNMVFIGLEFGLIRKRGGVVALEATTGKRLWCDYTHPAYTHSSPLYIENHRQVVIGSNDGKVRLYNAKNGEKMWKFTTFGGASYDPEDTTGFGEGDIKESFVYDQTHDYLIFGSIDGFLYILKQKDGSLVHHYKCAQGIYSTPCIYKGNVYFTSLDKKVRCINLDTLELVFETDIDSTRIFSSPVVINDRLYVGTNAARLHELDPMTGRQLGYYQALERITNSVVYNEKTDAYFLPTYANELIKLVRKDTTT